MAVFRGAVISQNRGDCSSSRLWLERSPRLTNQQQPPQTTISMASSTALAERRHVQQAWTDPDWQRLWLTLDRLPWRTLALVPAGVGAPADFTLTLAVTLSRTGMSHVGAPILVADGTQVPLDQLTAFLADVRACREGGERVIIALSTVTESPTTTSMAKDSDGVVLCLMLGGMRSSDAKRTIKLIGPSKFFGSVIVHAVDPKVSPVGYSVASGVGEASDAEQRK
jgi:hypothetical protein